MSEETSADILTDQANPDPAVKPGTDFTTGDTVRLKTGGPIMTLGTVIPSHTTNNQVECCWFMGEQKLSNWFFLGQLEVVSPEDAKAQLDREAEERSKALDRDHELRKLQLELAAQKPAGKA